MKFFSIFFSLCSLVIFARSTTTDSLATIEASGNNNVYTKEIENHHADLSKPSNVTSNISRTLVDSSSSSIEVSQCSKIIEDEDQESDTFYSNNEEPAIGLLSQDVLLDPGLITARLSRQAENSDPADYSGSVLVENNSSDVSNGDTESGIIDLSQQNSDVEESDLGAAEDRYRLPYPYRDQFMHGRYRTHYDRKEPNRSYLKYPVFPGR